MDDTASNCDTALLNCAFRNTQRLLRERVLLAGHYWLAGVLLTMCLCGDYLMDMITDVSVMVIVLVVEVCMSVNDL